MSYTAKFLCHLLLGMTMACGAAVAQQKMGVGESLQKAPAIQLAFTNHLRKRKELPKMEKSAPAQSPSLPSADEDSNNVRERAGAAIERTEESIDKDRLRELGDEVIILRRDP